MTCDAEKRYGHMNEISIGTIIKICGPVIDIRVENGVMLPINALIKCDDTEHHMEVAARLAPIRCAVLRLRQLTVFAAVQECRETEKG